ncbi:hypothetical protein [Variovorax sp. 350MFTsu5.1]|uniref:hypothetical protein n=1 Tax=Variovorax sp. 350MFTsu5.1 TaxID=3158365 RepID=UPI003AAC9287
MPTHSNGTVGARMTLKQYLAARQVVVRPDGREHLLEHFLDGKRWRRNVTLGPSHFMRLLAPLPGTDLIATVPQDIAAVVGCHLPPREIALLPAAKTGRGLTLHISC